MRLTPDECEYLVLCLHRTTEFTKATNRENHDRVEQKLKDYLYRVKS